MRAGLDTHTKTGADEHLRHPYYQQTTPVSLVIEEVERVWSAISERDDWSPLEAKLADIAMLKACHGAVADAG